MTIFRDACHYNNNSSVQTTEADYLIKRLNLDLKYKKLLDVGCGDGKISAAMSAQGAAVYGIDVSEEMIAFARQHFPECRFQHLAAERLAEIRGRFDVITSFNCLHWVKGIDTALAAARNRLKTDGIFFGLIYPRCHDLWDAATWVETLPAYQTGSATFSNPYHFYTRDIFEERLIQAGFAQTMLWQESKQATFASREQFKNYIAGWLPHCAHYQASFIDDWLARYMVLTDQTESETITMAYDIIYFTASCTATDVCSE
ncbi:Ubiquinone biosynthesis O-methyltransferase [Vibrio aerogenes CECT 7868]|uniref:Ubiquinone biosynthesis O-methyltransferase n=1 Tax=Vibrio aerogenes CECT 7868 TaxID=1216006 RepID=A0A1M6AZ16_9VIBR|nr:class I SAM-dependent methyltransferase [Vibrio aerogenes]SHI41702.1 Ubiquinone biosynthesis O-methyltransferase [Vibrio aerogenes CECT 7868]